ncbi:hypothetical protein RF55_19576 [Lasius niger]|uniref:RNase H type-1 domain-containing protein n=1 Tax=Lasius niger TaxID=67767 RepID=A0A0J7JZX3_LASNI|nr:hypothetical protein RF55_19576 [Lasius niger]
MYKDLTENITVDLDIGGEISGNRKHQEKRTLEQLRYTNKDIQIIDKISQKHRLSKNVVIYTDGSRPKGFCSTEAGIVFDESEEAFMVNLPRGSSTFTVEAFAIKGALEKLEQVRYTQYAGRRDVIIMSDCQSVLKAIKNNRMDLYKNKYVLEIRR